MKKYSWIFILTKYTLVAILLVNLVNLYFVLNRVNVEIKNMQTNSTGPINNMTLIPDTNETNSSTEILPTEISLLKNSTNRFYAPFKSNYPVIFIFVIVLVTILTVVAVIGAILEGFFKIGIPVAILTFEGSCIFYVSQDLEIFTLVSSLTTFLLTLIYGWMIFFFRDSTSINRTAPITSRRERA